MKEDAMSSKTRPKREGRFWPSGGKQARDQFIAGTTNVETAMARMAHLIEELETRLETINRANDKNDRGLISTATGQAQLLSKEIRASMQGTRVTVIQMREEMRTIQQEPGQQEPGQQEPGQQEPGHHDPGSDAPCAWSEVTHDQ
jgi:hypothetical protein